MERIMVLYYIRSGYSQVTVNTVIDSARSVGAVVGIQVQRTRFLPFKPAKRTPMTGEPFFGVGAVFICPLGRGGADSASIRSIQRPVPFRVISGMRYPKRLVSGGGLKAPVTQPIIGDVSKGPPDPRIRELLSAAVANSKACQNWLSKPKPNLERARVSIAHVIRDVDDLARLLE